MPKMLILMMDSVYPFGQKSQHQLQSETSVKVRQTKKVDQHNRQNILSKATFVKNLKNRLLIKVQSVLEEVDSIHVLYEHVEFNFNDFDSPQNQQFRSNVCEQLQELGHYFSNIGIKVQLSKNKIGINEFGNIKYFIGLDFEWEDNPDQNYLRSYYRNNINKLMNNNLNLSKISNIVIGKTSREYPPNEDKKIKEKQRKSSLATLPSRFNRWKKIDQKLSNIKASVRGYTPEGNSKTHFNTDIMTELQSKDKKRQQSPYRVSKRSEDRKYSVGDINNKFTAISKKLYEKQNDIRSQYGHKNEQTVMKGQIHADPSQIATKRSRSRIQEMKYREYQELTNSNKNYLKDFMSVLEDEPEQEPGSMNFVPTPPSSATKPLYSSTKQFSPEKKQKDDTSIMGDMRISELQFKAKEAVKNSLKVIQKFRQLQLKK